MHTLCSLIYSTRTDGAVVIIASPVVITMLTTVLQRAEEPGAQRLRTLSGSQGQERSRDAIPGLSNSREKACREQEELYQSLGFEQLIHFIHSFSHLAFQGVFVELYASPVLDSIHTEMGTIWPCP